MPIPAPTTYGVKGLRRAYLGRETTAGTAATGTWAWTGENVGMPEDKPKVVKVATQEGYMGGVNRSAIAYLESAIKFPETPFNFEQFPYLMAAGFGGPVANANKTYATPLPTTTSIAPNPYTIIAGDNFELYQLVYALVNSISITGKQKELVKMGATWQAGLLTQFTGSAPTITVPTAIEYLPFGNTTTYIDPVSAAYGTTQVPGMVLGFNIELKPKWEDKNTNDGQLSKSFSVFTGFEVTGKISIEQNSLSSMTGGFRSYLRSQTPIKLQIKGTGSVVTGAGTYTNKTLLINLPIKVEGAPAITDIGGNDLVEFSFWSQYDPTAADAGTIICVNNLAALP